VPFPIEDLTGERRDLAVPVIVDSFTGIYRWHAKRTLREVTRVRAALDGPRAVGVAMLATLAPEVGYVYYLMVLGSHRRQGLGRALVDDALALFRAEGRVVAYVVTDAENLAMVRMLEERGFRTVGRKETGYQDGGLGAWGLRSQMRIVYGETLYGLRLDAARSGTDR
jgi:ribosomal protein S18 acetylase RimI-like enzyme